MPAYIRVPLFQLSSIYSIMLILISHLASIRGNNDSDASEAANNSTVDNNVQRDFPPMFAYQRQFGPYSGGFGGNSAYGPGMTGFSSDNVNFDFQCKCQARSNKNMQTPLDANQAAQQQIQQLQDQVRRLQQQIQRSTSGKSSFEQFAQMLAQADGLECNCSGTSVSGVYPPQAYSRGQMGDLAGFSPYGNSGGMPYGGQVLGNNFNPGNYMPPAFGYGPIRNPNMPMTKTA